MFKISKEFTVSTGHRLSKNKSKCRNIHGHNYKIIVGIKSQVLDENGMVIDFGILKQIVNEIIEPLDHSLMLNEINDSKLEKEIKTTIEDLRIITVPYEPTAENMAKDIYKKAQQSLTYNTNIKMDYVTIFETENSKATYMEE